MSGTQTRVMVETRKRGFFGFCIKWIFIGFNVLMAWAMWTGVSNNVSNHAALTSDASRVGYAAGTALGAGFLLMIWMAGAVILGILVLLTRGKKIITERIG